MPPPYAGYLRVYQPLSSFAPNERERLTSYVSRYGSPSRAEGPRIERAAALRGLADARLPDVADAAGCEPAYILYRAGAALVCPWQTRARSAEALGEFLAELPMPLSEAFWPSAARRAAGAQPEGWPLPELQAELPILTSAWTIPARWYALFEQDERVLFIEGVDRGLVWRAEMANARRRAARALTTVRRAMGDSAVTLSVEMLARWLEEFHPRSVVELDYGGLVFLFDEGALRADTSAADVAEALAALADGDGERAGEAYGRVAARWRPAQLQANMN